MDKTKQNISKRNVEITEEYFTFLDHHISEVISGNTADFMKINEIAVELHISHKHLTHIIQKETGNHPCYFYDLKIIEEAKKMLQEKKLTISEIAAVLTYDPSNFSKFFKKMTGETPGAYRNNQQTHFNK